MADLSEKIRELSLKIANTPRDSRDVVEKYHTQIILELDSEDIISVPSPEHRNLHQTLWMNGYGIYNQLPLLDAPLNFVESEQRERFDVWYVVTYILKRKLTDWECSLVQGAARESLHLYHHPLEELLKKDILEEPITPQSP